MALLVPYAGKVDFIDTTDDPINLDTDFFDGGYEYPVYKKW